MSSAARLAAFTAIAAVPLAAANADEGMWTFDAFPAAKMRAAYGWAPDQAWLDRVRAAAVRLTGGCSASFVSPSGLILTNHHCVVDCAQNLSTADGRSRRQRLHRRAPADERKCPGQQAEVVDLDLATSPPQSSRRSAAPPARRWSRRATRRSPSIEKAGCADTRDDPLPGRHRCSAAASTSSTTTANMRTCGSSGRPSSRPRSSAATPTTSTSRATRSMRRSCALMRTARRSRSPQHLEVEPARAEVGEATFVVGNPGLDPAALHARADRLRARGAAAGHAGHPVGTARTADRRDGRQRREDARRRRHPVRGREQPQGLHRPERGAQRSRRSSARWPTPKPTLQAKSAGNAAIGDPWSDVGQAVRRLPRLLSRRTASSPPGGRPVRLCA